MILVNFKRSIYISVYISSYPSRGLQSKILTPLIHTLRPRVLSRPLQYRWAFTQSKKHGRFDTIEKYAEKYVVLFIEMLLTEK